MEFRMEFRMGVNQGFHNPGLASGLHHYRGDESGDE
jgi:hypothetical protein